MIPVAYGDDYVVRIKKTPVCKQSKIPKPPADYNGSKPIKVDIPRDKVYLGFKRASELNK